MLHKNVNFISSSKICAENVWPSDKYSCWHLIWSFSTSAPKAKSYVEQPQTLNIAPRSLRTSTESETVSFCRWQTEVY